MQRRFIYIINPVSGTGSKQSLRLKIEAAAQGLGFPFDIFPSVASGDYSFLFDFIKERHITDVVIAGGDGTINRAINSLRHTGVQFGLLPCGSGNGLAFSAGIPKNLDKALQIIYAGNSAAADAFTINGGFACMLCGLGFDAQVAHDFAADPRRGLATYVKKTVQGFFSAPAYQFGLQLNDQLLQLEAYFISIANSNQFGNNFTIAPRASLTDGLLDVVIVTRQNKLAFLWQTIRQVTGFNHLQQVSLLNKDAGVIYFQTDALKISNEAQAPLHLDGDPVATSKELDIHIIKNAFRLIFP